jgi:hypothetical protein
MKITKSELRINPVMDAILALIYLFQQLHLKTFYPEIASLRFRLAMTPPFGWSSKLQIPGSGFQGL